ncbi:MAG: DNA-processing protein DprA [Candidatus Xenobiia bacterium LiM19]
MLGCGIDTIYPVENRALSEQIVKDGAVISEFPPGIPAFRQNFPMRNRIIAGMTLGTLVIEAGEKSGSLITAEMALNYGREVFAVPGSIASKLSKGTHQLIKEGAALVDTVEDIAGELWINRHMTYSAKSEISAMITQEHFTADEKAILQYIDDEGKTAAAIAELSGREPSRAMTSLSLLELKGFIRRGAENLIFRSEKLKTLNFSDCEPEAH